MNTENSPLEATTAPRSDTESGNRVDNTRGMSGPNTVSAMVVAPPMPDHTAFLVVALRNRSFATDHLSKKESMLLVMRMGVIVTIISSCWLERAPPADASSLPYWVILATVRAKTPMSRKNTSTSTRAISGQRKATTPRRVMAVSALNAVVTPLVNSPVDTMETDPNEYIISPGECVENDSSFAPMLRRIPSMLSSLEVTLSSRASTRVRPTARPMNVTIAAASMSAVAWVGAADLPCNELTSAEITSGAPPEAASRVRLRAKTPSSSQGRETRVRFTMRSEGELRRSRHMRRARRKAVLMPASGMTHQVRPTLRIASSRLILTRPRPGSASRTHRESTLSTRQKWSPSM